MMEDSLPDRIGAKLARVEALLQDHPSFALVELRKVQEQYVAGIAETHRLDMEDCVSAWERLNCLETHGILDPEELEILHRLRKVGNQAAHDDLDNGRARQTAIHCLEDARRLPEFVQRHQKTESAIPVRLPLEAQPDAVPNSSDPVSVKAISSPFPESPTRTPATPQRVTHSKGEAKRPERSTGARQTPFGESPTQRQFVDPAEKAATTRDLACSGGPQPSSPSTSGTLPTEGPPSEQTGEEVLVARAVKALQESVRRIEEELSLVEGYNVRLSEHLERAIAEISEATAPERIGVAGEFRVGKSTLINAMLGIRLALVRTSETTATLNCYGHGRNEQYCIHFDDGRREDYSDPHELNELLERRRTDADWLSTIKFVEFRSPRSRALGFELWDAPGLGGNSFNEDLANRFINRISGAIWVLDAELLGNASLLEPLSRLRSAGKTVIGVLNRVDGLEDDQIEEALRFVSKTYGNLFRVMLPLSATEALQAAGTNSQDERLELLLTSVREHLVDGSTESREARIEYAVDRARSRVADAAEIAVLPLREQVDLLSHLIRNHHEALQAVMEALPGMIQEETAELWTGVAELIRSDFDALMTEYGAASSSTNRLPIPVAVNQLLERLQQETDLETAWRETANILVFRLKQEWSHLCARATLLASVAAPPSVIGTEQSRASMLEQNTSELSADEESTRHALVAGSSSAAGLGVIAASSFTVGFPIMLAALPVAGAVKYFSQHAALKRYQSASTAALLEAKAKVPQMIATKKEVLRVALQETLESTLTSELGHAIDRELEDKARQFFGSTDMDAVRQVVTRVSAECQHLDPHVGAERRHSVHIPAGRLGIEALRSVLADEVARIDLCVHHEPSDLERFLEAVSPGVMTRILIISNTAQPRELIERLSPVADSRSGHLRVRLVRLRNSHRRRPDPALITSQRTWRVSGDLLDRGSCDLLPATDARLVIAHAFAEWWTVDDTDGAVASHPIV